MIKLKDDNSNWWEWYQHSSSVREIKCAECGHDAGHHGSGKGDKCYKDWDTYTHKRVCKCELFTLESFSQDITKMRNKQSIKLKMKKELNKLNGTNS